MRYFFSRMPFGRLFATSLGGILAAYYGPNHEDLIYLLIFLFSFLIIWANGLLTWAWYLVWFALAWLWAKEHWSRVRLSLPQHEAYVFALKKLQWGSKRNVLDGEVCLLLQGKKAYPVRLPIRIYLKERGPWSPSQTYFLVSKALQKPEPPRIPFGFDALAYAEQAARYTQVFLNPWDWQTIGKKDWSPSLWQRVQAQATRLLDPIPKVQEREVMKAMLLAWPADIPSELYRQYAWMGAVHVLSVSGMHLALIFAFLNAFIGQIKRRSKRWAWACLIGSLAMVWAYAGITLWVAPVSRAVLVFTLLQLADVLGRPPSGLNLLAVAAWVLIWWNPSQVFDLGFQLSFLAVLGILLWMPKWEHFRRFQAKTWFQNILAWIWTNTGMALGAQCFTLPLCWYYFHQMPQPLVFLMFNPLWVLGSSLLLSLGFVYLLLQLPCLYWGWDLGMQVLGIGLQSLSQAFHACLGSIAQGLPSVCSFIHFPWFMVLISYAMLGLLVFLPTWRWRLALLLLALGSYQAYLYERLPTQAQLHALYSSKGPCFVWRKGRQAQVLLEHGAALDVAWQDRNLLPFLAYLGVKDTLSRAYASDKNLGIFLAGQRFVWVQKLQDMRLNEKPNALWLSPKYQRKKAPWWRPFQGIPLVFHRKLRAKGHLLWPLHGPGSKPKR